MSEEHEILKGFKISCTEKFTDKDGNVIESVTKINESDENFENEYRKFIEKHENEYLKIGDKYYPKFVKKTEYVTEEKEDHIVVTEKVTYVPRFQSVSFKKD